MYTYKEISVLAGCIIKIGAFGVKFKDHCCGL